MLPLSTNYHDWCACQYDRPDLGGGFAVFFRRHESPFPIMEVELKNIDPDCDYDVGMTEAAEDPPRKKMTGGELSCGMQISIPRIPGSLLLVYSRVRGEKKQQDR